MFALLMGVIGCGSETPRLGIAYTGTDISGDTDVTNAVFCIRNIPQGNQGLDQDNNGIPDLFLYPSACGSIASCSDDKPASCGFDVSQSGEVTIGDVPLDFQYELRAEFRNAAGDVLYCGEETFTNQSNLGTLSVSLSTGECS